MAPKPKWEPPADPDLEQLARTGWREWEMDQPKVVAFDTETTGLEYHDTAFCATLAWVHDDVITGPEIRGHYFEFDRFDGREAVRRILSHAEVIVAHNAKFDLHKMEGQGWTLRPEQVLHDTEAMAHLDDEHRKKGLKELAVGVLGFDDTIEVPGKTKNKETGKMEDIVRLKPRSVVELAAAKMWAKKEHGFRTVAEVGYHLLPRGVLVPYAVLDAVWTYQLACRLHPRILRYPDVAALYEQEIQLTRGAIYELEKAGLGTDVPYVAKQCIAYRNRCLQHELAIERIVGKPVRTGDVDDMDRDAYFNPSSSAPDARDLLAAAGFERESYDADNLATIDHPLARLLLEYRKDVKILDGYFVALQRDTGPDGIFHPSIRQHGTVSGRTSAGAERGDQ